MKTRVLVTSMVVPQHPVSSNTPTMMAGLDCADHEAGHSCRPGPASKTSDDTAMGSRRDMFASWSRQTPSVRDGQADAAAV